MLSVFDVAKYILEKLCANTPITTWKLQKLVYYSQAWSLVWDDAPLFREDIQAWANGPVCPDLYSEHKGQFQISTIERGNTAKLSDEQIETIDAVIKHYGGKTAQYLSELTHREAPWKSARKGVKAGDRGNKVIKLDDMAEFYGGLK